MLEPPTLPQSRIVPTATRDFICVDGHYLNLDRVTLITPKYDDEFVFIGYEARLVGEEKAIILPPLTKEEMQALLDMSRDDFYTTPSEEEDAGADEGATS